MLEEDDARETLDSDLDPDHGRVDGAVADTEDLPRRRSRAAAERSGAHVHPRGPRAPGTAHDRCEAPSGAVHGLCVATAIGLAVGRAAEDVQRVVKGSPAAAPWTGDDVL